MTGKDWVGLTIALVFIALMVTTCVRLEQKEWRIGKRCVKAGYAGEVQWKGDYYCIGYNSDGAVQILEAEALNVQGE